MEKIKIVVNGNKEIAKRAKEYFDYMGYHISTHNRNNCYGWSLSDYLGDYYVNKLAFDEDPAKEVTIEQLHDMVVLKRNDPKDANVYQDGDVPCLYDLYLTSDNNLYFHSGLGGWKLSSINDDEDYRKLLKPIQNNDLPFDSEESLNDKVASAEEARQKQPNKKTIDVMDGVKLMESLARFNNTDRGADFDNFELFEKHSHYKKDVSHLEFIDVYRVLDLFGVESHAVGHAIKKLLCSGQRGAKDKAQDIQEAIDSLSRELEMMRENDNS